jgi:hypothetical protein
MKKILFLMLATFFLVTAVLSIGCATVDKPATVEGFLSSERP